MTQHHDHLDADLRPLAAALDELGARERESAPAGLEERLRVRTLPLLRGEAHADTPDERPSPVIARIGFRRALQVAAAVAVVATGGVATWLALRPTPSTTQPTPPIANLTTDELIEEIDTEAADWFTDLDSLQTTADAGSSTSTDFWSLPDEDTLDTLLPEENS